MVPYSSSVGPNLHPERQLARQGAAGVGAADAADLLVGGEHEVDIALGPPAGMQFTRGLEQHHDGRAVVQEIAADEVAEGDQTALAGVDAHPGAGPDAGVAQLLGCAAGEDVDVAPIQRLAALIRFGCEDPRALGGGVLRTQRQHAAQHLLVAQHRHRAQAEVAGIHRAEVGEVQAAVGKDALDQHRQLVHVRHHADRRTTLAGGTPQQAHDVAGRIHPHLVHQRTQFPAADVANRVLLPARAVRPQQLLQQFELRGALAGLPGVVRAQRIDAHRRGPYSTMV